MSATAMVSEASPLVRFWAAPIGKKAVMAVTGLILVAFVIGHMLGNLQIYLGPEKINAYGAFLHGNLGVLWVVRLALLASVVMHITAAIQLQGVKNAARPVSYKKHDAIASSYASRTMIWSGPILAAFIVYHLLHFTVGAAHPDFRMQNAHTPDVYHNVIAGFRQIPASLVYIAAMVMLGMHLYHGAWSLFQSLGFNHPRYTPILRAMAKLAAVVIVAGNSSIPIAVMTGIIR